MKILLGSFFIFMATFAYAQNMYPYGQFEIRKFDHNEQNGGFQNWDIIQNNEGYIYVANNEAVLEFNGNSWTKFSFENQEHPRSFAKNHKGEIFVGGNNEFGKVDYTEKGAPYIEKLSTSVDSIDFKAIWQIYSIEEKIYFVSRQYIFEYDSTGLKTIETPEGAELVSSCALGNKIICRMFFDDRKSVYVFVNGEFTEVDDSESFIPRLNISLENRDYLLDGKGSFHELKATTDGFRIKQDMDKGIALQDSASIICAISNDKMIALATKNSGVQLFNLDGKFLRSFSSDEGLENLQTHNIIFDNYNNLWLCTDNGVIFIETSSALTIFDERQGVTAGTTEHMAFTNDDALLATHNDLFKSSTDKGRIRFEPQGVIENGLFQIKTFKFSDGNAVRMVIGNDGILTMDDNYEITIVAKDVYAWDLFQSESDRDRIYIGLDGGGVGALYYSKGSFKYENYPNTSGDVRAICELDGNVYYTVKYEGAHLLDTTKSQAENKLKGLIQYGDSTKYDQFTLEVFNDQIFIGTLNGLYKVEDNKLVPSGINDDVFVQENLLIHRIMNDGDGKLWIHMFFNSGSDNEIGEFGYITENDGELEWNHSDFAPLKDEVIFCLAKSRDGSYWLGGGKSVYAYNEHTDSKFDQPFQAFITKVFLNEEELFLQNTHYAKDEEYVIDYQNNTFKFEFGSNAFLGGIQNEFSYFLEGEDKNWSKWKSKPEAVYQRLAEGDYIFHVKAKNYYGFESEERTFAFTISPPWYRSWWAYVIYGLLVILLIYVIIRVSISRVKAQNEKLEQIVEERTAEIAEQNSELEHQKAEIQQKTNDILDSIKYAERIQRSFLASKKLLDANLNEHFVFFQPKDVVSGDFYWAANLSDGNFAIVNADSTGHGVPGAIMSILNISSIESAVKDKLTEPADIFNDTRNTIIERLKRDGSPEGGKDGMDASLITFNADKTKMTYVAAQNPIWVIRDGELTEIKAEKMPVGKHDKDNIPFKGGEYDIQKGDKIYTITDGFQDQFGGPRGKKFMIKKMREFVLSISDLPMNEQHQKIEETFTIWKDDLEQVDDVCVIGIRI
ncbi:MAG: serine phosphatase RsbU (regulator of sigma subunit) [Arenicella sp.]|jgi:serine phosphatase RsbU (regulator of sigma subunit)